MLGKRREREEERESMARLFAARDGSAGAQQPRKKNRNMMFSSTATKKKVTVRDLAPFPVSNAKAGETSSKIVFKKPKTKDSNLLSFNEEDY